MKAKDLQLFVSLVCVVSSLLVLSYLSVSGFRDDQYLLTKELESRVNPVIDGIGDLIEKKFAMASRASMTRMSFICDQECNLVYPTSPSSNQNFLAWAAKLKTARPPSDEISKSFVYRRLDADHLVGVKHYKGNQLLCVVIEKEKFVESLKTALENEFAHHEDFGYQITDSEGECLLASAAHPLRQPQKLLTLGGDLPRWTIAVEVAGVEALKANIEKRRFFKIASLVVLLAVTALSLFFIIRSVYRERELSLMKTNFVSSVSHEMRLPLSSLRMIGEMFALGKVRDPHTADKYHAILKDETERLTRLIDGVLDFSRMESKRQPYRLLEQDLSALIKDAVGRFSRLAESRGASIALEAEDGLRAAIDADGMAQVLFNLLDNAVKYSSATPTIKVKAFTRGSEIVVQVVDNGIGISDTVLGKIFDPFYRAENESTRERRGIGIGLSVVKHIVDAHHGTVEVASREGEGSAFSVVIPAAHKM